MKLSKAVIAASLMALAAVWLSMPDSCAQDTTPGGEDKIIAEMKVRDNRAISSETILLKLRTRVGNKFSQDVINEDIKRLYATQYFTNVSVDVEGNKNGVVVTFTVEEKPVIEDIIFKGNKVLSSNKLRSAMRSKPNDMMNLSVLAQDIAEMKNMYSKKGHPAVDINYEIGMDRELNKSVITIIIDEKTRVKITSVNVTGAKAIKAGDIKKILGTKPAWLFNPGIFRDDMIEDDIDKIKAMYDDKGYLDAEVTPKLDYSDDGTQLAVTFNINENKQYLVGDITVEGNLVLPEKKVYANIKLKPGKPFSARALRDDMVNIRDYYYEFGYMNAVIDAERGLNQTTGNIDIVYSIDGKDLVYVGKIDIRGNTKTKGVVIRRELRLYPGEKFDGKKIKRSKERIYNLGFFEDVSFDTEATSDPNIRDFIVSVKETKTGEFSFGGGYSSIDMLMGFAEISQRNFDILNFPTFMGAGQNLAIKAEIGMVRNNYNVSWTEPWIFGWPYSFGFDVYNMTHNQQGDLGYMYDESRTGGDLRLGHEFTDTFRGDLVYRLELINITDIIDNASQDVKDEAGKNWISDIFLSLTQDTRDNLYNPGRGYVINGTLENAGGFIMGDKDFVKGTFSANYYHTFFQRFVLEIKGRGGLSDAYSNTKEVPIYERFYAGGQNTIRGYKERRVGPRDSGSDEPIGGEAIVVGNAEVVFPIYEKIIKGAVFYDIGNVWRRAEQFFAGDFKSGVGVGVRVKTPVGPVRVDYGYPLNKNHNDDSVGEFYFSMSRGF